MKRIIGTAVMLAVCAVGVRGQSLADAARATQGGPNHAYSEVTQLQQKIIDLERQISDLRRIASACVPASAPPAKTADNTIDRTKFDHVYEAAKAVISAAYEASPGQLKQLLLALDTALSIASDKVTTKGEIELNGKYLLALKKFNLALAQRGGRGTDWMQTMTDATDTLDEANAMYLGR